MLKRAGIDAHWLYVVHWLGQRALRENGVITVATLMTPFSKNVSYWSNVPGPSKGTRGVSHHMLK